MAKWDDRAAGSSAHVHLSLAGLDGGSAFHDAGAEFGMSATMRALRSSALIRISSISAMRVSSLITQGLLPLKSF